MTEAAAAIVDWGFAGPLQLERIEWRAIVGNVGSARIERQLGVRYGGILRRAMRNDARIRADA